MGSAFPLISVIIRPSILQLFHSNGAPEICSVLSTIVILVLNDSQESLFQVAMTYWSEVSIKQLSETENKFTVLVQNRNRCYKAISTLLRLRGFAEIHTCTLKQSLFFLKKVYI